jgi:hypothetical protein
MGVEMFLVPTVVLSWEICRRDTPPIRVDGITVPSNIKRDKQRSSRPEPNLDAVLLATCEGIEPTSAGVEVLTVGTRTANLGSTALVEVGVGVAVR